MKKTIKIIVLLLVAIVALTTFAACGSSSPEKAKKNLEGKGYTVTIETDSAKFAEINESLELEDGDIKAMLSASNGKEGEQEVSVVILYCKNNDAARKLWDNKNFRNAFSGSRGRVNSVIWTGNEQGWKDAQ